MVHNLSSDEHFPENDFRDKWQNDLHNLESSFPNFDASFLPKFLNGFDIVNKREAVYFLAPVIELLNPTIIGELW